MTRLSMFVLIVAFTPACSSDSEEPKQTSGPWNCYSRSSDNDFDGNPLRCECFPPDVVRYAPYEPVPSCTGLFSPYESVCFREPGHDWVPPSCECHQVMCGTETEGDLAGVCRCARTGFSLTFDSTSCEGAVCCAGKWEQGLWQCRCGEQPCAEGFQQVDRCDASTVPIDWAERVDSCDIVEP